jgi:hypothetical protein
VAAPLHELKTELRELNDLIRTGLFECAALAAALIFTGIACLAIVYKMKDSLFPFLLEKTLAKTAQSPSSESAMTSKDMALSAPPTSFSPTESKLSSRS